MIESLDACHLPFKICHPDRSIAIGSSDRNAGWRDLLFGATAKRLGGELGRLVFGE
jgi:hypothetical protein